MADEVKKVVTYEIRGNTVNLEKTLEAAINNANLLQQKLQTVSTIPYKRGKNADASNYERQAAISKTVAQLESLKTKLSSESIQAVTPDQLSLLTSMNEELGKYIVKISDTSKTNSIAKKSFEKMNSTISDMNYTLRKAGIGVTSFVTALGKISLMLPTLKIAWSYIKKLYNEAASFVETINLFNVAVGDANDELELFIKNMSNAFGLDTEPLYRATAIFKQLANTLGDASDASVTFSKGATQLVYDLSSLYNVDVDTMLQAFKSGLTGQTKPMMKYGISVHKATIEQTMLAHGISKTYSELNEIEKMYLRYITMLDQSSNAQGDMAKTLESPANQLRIAKDQVTLFVRNLGNLVLMLSKFVLPVFNGFAKGINTVLSALNNAAGYTIPDYSDNLAANNQMLDDGTESIEDYENAVSGLLAPLDEINQASSNNEGLNIGQVDQSILDTLSSYDNLMSRVTSTTQKFADIFNAVFNPQIFTGLGQIVGTAFNLIDTAIDATTNTLSAVAPVLNVLTTGIGYLLTGVTWLIDKAFIPLQLWLQGVTSNIWTLIGAFVAFNLIQAAATGSMKSMIAVKAAAWFATTTKSIALNTVGLIKNAAAWVANTAKVIANTIANWWHNASLAAKIGLLTMGAGLLIVPIVLAAAGVFSSKASEVPQMAKGGVVTRETHAIIGEGKYNEAVIPLGRSPQMKELKRDIANETSRKISQPRSNVQRSAEQPTPIILQVSGRELGRTSITNINRVRRQVGVDLA